MGNKSIKMNAVGLNKDAIYIVQPSYITYYTDKARTRSIVLSFATDMQDTFYEKIKDAIHTNKQITIYCYKTEINCIEITYPLDKTVETEIYRSASTTENDDEYFYNEK